KPQLLGMILLLLILLAVIFIILSTTRLHLHPFLALIIATFAFGLLAGIPIRELLTTINQGFGGTIGNIGLIIIFGLIIGAFLEKSGGAYSLAQQVLQWVGTKSIHAAMGIIGYIVSIPVFADSGFIILASLNKALSNKAQVSVAGTAIALSMGLMVTHTMVPPTPGPIAAASILGADLGRVILIGLFASMGALVVAVLFAKKYAASFQLNEVQQSTTHIEAAPSYSPSAGKAFLPIIIPILLIILKSIAEFPTKPLGESAFIEFLLFMGNPVVALFLGMLLAFLLPRKFSRSMLGTSGWVGEALQQAAMIILITGAGGAFGKVLQSSGVGEVLEDMVGGARIGIWLPFLVAAALKTAQGSSTVALITTASIMAPLLPSLGLDGEMTKALAVVAIGAGSAVASHANDSFFWVVTQMTGMSVRQGYLLQSLGSGITGLSAMILLFLLSLFL
ncbi:MAG: GntP family permease, partial [Bacteroidota bacterium]